MQTNRDLYVFVAGLAARAGDRTLEEFLRALWQAATRVRDVDVLPLAQVGALLSSGLDEAPPPYDPAWTTSYRDRAGGFAGWERTVLDQIVDLHELAEVGTLADQAACYFGVSAPRGGHWYNTRIAGYLECAVAGSYGGYDDGDRMTVPGDVAVVVDGQLTSVPAADIPLPEIDAIAPLSWDDFADFLRTGQLYE